VLLVATAAIRYHRLGVPLERDEGEYAYAGQLILQGEAPYAGVYNMKLPGIYLTYAAVLGTFGETIRAIHLGLLLANLATTGLVFALGRRLRDDVTGVAAAGAFAVLSLDASVTGLVANAEHFVILPAVGGAVLLLRALEGARLVPFFGSGLLMGLALVVKQQGVAFAAFGVAVLLLETPWWRPGGLGRLVARSAVYCLGVALPFAAICLWLHGAGVFDRFWFLTVTYARTYVSQVPPSAGLEILREVAGLIVGAAPWLWLLALAGLVVTLCDRRRRAFVGAFTLCSTAATTPGLLFREHYFILLLPAAALLVGFAISALAAWCARAPAVLRVLPAGVLLFALGWPIIGQRDELFLASDVEMSRAVYGENPFPESVVVADYLARHTAPSDTIAVLGSEPQLYFYARRRAATGYVYTYHLMEEHPFALEMQHEMMAQIDAQRPAYVVFVNVAPSWLVHPGSHRYVFDWIDEWLPAHYEQVGLVEILAEDHTAYHWDQEARGRTPEAANWLGVYRRKDP
jgi:hypothetical protein